MKMTTKNLVERLAEIDRKLAAPSKVLVEETYAPGSYTTLAYQWPDENMVICQGCGVYRSGKWLGKSHDCHRNDDGTYEEGGTFQ